MSFIRSEAVGGGGGKPAADDNGGIVLGAVNEAQYTRHSTLIFAAGIAHPTR